MNPAQQRQQSSMSNNEAAAAAAVFDAPLIALTNQCGGDLTKVLQAFFSFLHRRTDFYLVPNQEDLQQGLAKMGFPEGYAEKVLLASFRQFPLRRLPKVGNTSSTTSTSAPAPSTAASLALPDKTASITTSKVEKDTTEDDPGNKETESSTKASTTTAKTKSPSANEQQDTDESSSSSTNVRITDEGLQVPVGNGGSTKQYKWTQTIEECSVLVRVPENTRGKDLDVSIKSSSLSVKLVKKNHIDSDSSPTVLLDGTLEEKVIPSESTWTIEGGVLHIILYKHKKSFWSTILQGDDKIDTTLVDNRRNIGEYDEATQAQIRKIIFDQNQAKKGLPSSDEISGNTPTVPETLPSGVEYINQEKIDKHFQAEKK